MQLSKHASSNDLLSAFPHYNQTTAIDKEPHDRMYVQLFVCVTGYRHQYPNKKHQQYQHKDKAKQKQEQLQTPNIKIKQNRNNNSHIHIT